MTRFGVNYTPPARAGSTPAPPRTPRPALVIDGDWSTGVGRSRAMDLFDEWSAMAEQSGTFPALVHERFTDDLLARGITEGVRR